MVCSQADDSQPQTTRQPPQNNPPPPPSPEPTPAPPEPKTEEKPAPPPKEEPKVKAIKDNTSEAFGLFLCGTGESGKTTFTRQLRIKFLGGFEGNERKQFIETIRGNLIETMQLLLIYLERNGLSVEDDLSDTAHEIAELDPFNSDFNEDIATDLKDLWQDPNIEEAFKHRDETAIPDHMEYFFEKIDDLQDDDYVPSDEDILKARIRTIGVESVTFDIQGARIRIYDVGGQQNERSKWPKIQEEVESIIYCVSFGDFNRPMFEDPTVLRIHDALETFSIVTKDPKYANAPLFLLCNKIDSFNEKVKQTDEFLKVFPDYKGDPHNPDDCANYLIEQFKQKVGFAGPDKVILPYKIVALDPDTVVNATEQICQYINEHFYED